MHYLTRSEMKHDVHLVGVKDDQNEVIAACLLTEAPALRFFKYFYTIAVQSWITAILN